MSSLENPNPSATSLQSLCWLWRVSNLDAITERNPNPISLTFSGRYLYTVNSDESHIASIVSTVQLINSNAKGIFGWIELEVSIPKYPLSHNQMKMHVLTLTNTNIMYMPYVSHLGEDLRRICRDYTSRTAYFQTLPVTYYRQRHWPASEDVWCCTCQIPRSCMWTARPSSLNNHCSILFKGGAYLRAVFSLLACSEPAVSCSPTQQCYTPWSDHLHMQINGVHISVQLRTSDPLVCIPAKAFPPLCAPGTLGRVFMNSSTDCPETCVGFKSVRHLFKGSIYF